MNLIIRQARLGDASRIASLSVALARETGNSAPNRRVLSTGVKALLAEPAHGFYVVAENEKRLVGMVEVTPEIRYRHDENWWWLENAYVHPTVRGSGVFPKILEFVNEIAMRAENVCGIIYHAENKNLAARRYYREPEIKQSASRIMEIPLTKKKISRRRSRTT